MWELELKRNLATQALNVKTWSTKIHTVVQQYPAFWAFIRLCYICRVQHVLTFVIPPTPQPLAKAAQKIDGDMEVPQRLTGVLDICYPSQPSLWRMEPED
jgi:hypothetical protein